MDAVDQPWARGVSPERRRRARELAREAVDLHKQLLRGRAAAKYEEALGYWEHPGMRWNLALLRFDMGQHLDAYENLERVLLWGEDAFDEKRRARYREFRDRLFANHLAVIEAACDERGARVALDGAAWFVAPGRERRVVLPGEHVVIARKPGYFSVAQSITVPAGKQARVTLRMDRAGILETRRFATWKPWAVLGAGAAVTLVGGGLLWQADRYFVAAARAFTATCEDSTGCPPGKPAPYARAVWGNRVAVGALTAGTVGLAAGLTLLVLNRPRAFRGEDRDQSEFQLIPTTPGDGLGVSASLRF